MYLQHYVSANQRDWAKLLDVAQFSYNLLRSESTGRSPFEIVIGQPITPNKVAIGSAGQHRGLLRRYVGPFPIIKRVGKQAYKDLPPNLKMHPVSHVSLLKPFVEDHEDPERAISSRALAGVRIQYSKEVEEIISDESCIMGTKHLLGSY
ncbi:hypothetical protein GH714_021225 [Hevea brasiliensis]|uniref:Tf2-1-like SH3-like domain-containing protein n=1 Tax=Hevea brasiliensis TaxID=3981 RepID=A0A6A6LT68_HEVBR|nr:hypothetical protein GH714_021225 [Hevea brasiliensis]